MTWVTMVAMRPAAGWPRRSRALRRPGDHIADPALGHGAGHVHGHGGHLGGAGGLLEQQGADLRAVAVGDDHAVAAHDEVGQGLGGLLHVAELLGARALLAGRLDGVAAQGEDHGFRGAAGAHALSSAREGGARAGVQNHALLLRYIS